MNMSGDQQGRRSYRPSFLMLVVIGVHAAGIGSFMMMSGCATKRQAAIEPPPAPVLAPGSQSTVAPQEVAMPRPVFRPSIEPVPESVDSAGASTYTVQKGDSLSKIAARAGISLRELSELNNIANPNQIRIGQKLLLPAHAKALPNIPVPAAPKAQEKTTARSTAAPAGPAKASGESHVVQTGDTLGKLAVRYGTTVAAFREVNSLKSDTIRIGQKLVIPAGKKAEAATTASAPAATSSTQPSAVTEPSAPAPDPVLTPMAASTVAVEPSPTDIDVDGETPFPYTVKDGDSLESIALKFSAKKDVIMRLNNLTSETVRPGQKLLIPWN